MEKVKIKTGIAALIVVASMFAGWEAMLIAYVLLLLFCDLDEKIKKLMIKVIAFCAGLALLNMFWSVVTSGVDLLLDTLLDFIALINSYLDVADKIDTTKLTSYLIEPINILVRIVGRFITFGFLIFKVLFILAVLSGKDSDSKFDLFVKRFIKFEKDVENPNFGSDNGQMPQGPMPGQPMPQGPMGGQPMPNYSNYNNNQM